MSILLDAVTRDKQQSQAITHDVVLTPRAQYRERQTSKSARFAVIFTCSLLLMILAAWLLSRVLYPEAGAVVQTLGVNGKPVSAKASSSQLQPQRQLQLQSELEPEPESSRGELISEVRLAGKVALPVAQAFETQAATVRNVGQSPSANQTQFVTSKPQSNDLMAALLSAQESVEHSGSQQARINQNSSRQGTQTSSQQLSADEPIILGAHSNKRGDELLESLKYQVEYAANDVGLEREKPADNNNNLLAAFEAALKDVERENAVASPVTEEKLDPIPTTPKSDAIPKYGQLPAGLQLQVPEFNINAHVYSSVPDNRWLNVDGAELQEGDSIQGKLTIVEIRPRDVVLAIEGTEFKVPAI
ncbi:general secretion pathway protein GspB [Shewanella sp. 0m-4]